MSASRITITPSELRDSAGIFGKEAQNMEDMLSLLNKEIESLTSTWDGAAQDQFFATYQEMKPTLDQFPKVLDGINKQLIAVADTLEQTDDALAAKLKGKS